MKKNYYCKQKTKAKILKICLIAVVAVCNGCKTSTVSVNTDYICYEDGKSRYGNSIEFLKCVNVPPKDKNDYVFFEIDSEPENELHTAVQEADKKIKGAIVVRLKRIFQNKLKIRVYNSWDMDKIKMPVTYRHFYKKTGNSYRIKSVAVFLKKDTEPLAILRYLPLEYKLPFLDQLEIEYRRTYN